MFKLWKFPCFILSRLGQFFDVFLITITTCKFLGIAAPLFHWVIGFRVQLKKLKQLILLFITIVMLYRSFYWFSSRGLSKSCILFNMSF